MACDSPRDWPLGEPPALAEWRRQAAELGRELPSPPTRALALGWSSRSRALTPGRSLSLSWRPLASRSTSIPIPPRFSAGSRSSPPKSLRPRPAALLERGSSSVPHAIWATLYAAPGAFRRRTVASAVPLFSSPRFPAISRPVRSIFRFSPGCAAIRAAAAPRGICSTRPSLWARPIWALSSDVGSPALCSLQVLSGVTDPAFWA